MSSDEPAMDASRVPSELCGFMAVAEKWGAVGSDSERYDLADRADENPDEMAELEAFANSWNKRHEEILDEWLDRESMVKCREGAKFYFLLMLIGELDLTPKRPLSERERFDQAIDALGKRGSYRVT